MWFLFGFVTLGCFIAWKLLLRLDARWEGTANLAYEYREDQKLSGTGLRIGIAAPDGFDFELKSETGVDRLFKRLGLSREQQVADEVFDRDVYVVSADPGVHRALSESPALRTSVRRLLALSDKTSYDVECVRCHRGRLWVRCHGWGLQSKGNVELFAWRAVPLLRDIARVLAEVPMEKAGRRRDPFVLRAALILACSSGLALNGAVQLVRLYWIDFPYTDEAAALLLPAVAAGGAVTALLAFAALLLLGRSARTHLVLLEVLLVGSFGATATAYAGARDLNMEWDAAAARTYEATVAFKPSDQEGDRLIYYIRIEPLDGFPGDTKIHVPPAAYYRLSVKDRVTLQVRPGFLGARWVARLEGPNGLVLK